MFRPGFYLLRRGWPVVLVIVPFGVIYCLLLCFLSEAIVAEEHVDHFWDPGPEMLFTFNSLLLGWVTVVILEHRFGATGLSVFLLAVPCWAVAIGAGFALAALVSEDLPAPPSSYALYCSVSTICAGALRIYFPALAK